MLRGHRAKRDDGPGPDGSAETTEPEFRIYPHSHQFVFFQKVKGHIVHVTTRDYMHTHTHTRERNNNYHNNIERMKEKEEITKKNVRKFKS